MKPVELFGDKEEVHIYKMSGLYNPIKNKDCVVMRWSEGNVVCIVKYKDDFYALHSQKGPNGKIFVMDGDVAFEFHGADKDWKPKIIDKELYKEFKDWILVRKI